MCFKAVLRLHLLWVEKQIAIERQPKTVVYNILASWWKNKLEWLQRQSIRPTVQEPSELHVSRSDKKVQSIANCLEK